MLLEVDSSECDRFDGRGRDDGPAKFVTEEEEDDAEADDLWNLEDAVRDCVEELGLFTMLCR